MGTDPNRDGDLTNRGLGFVICVGVWTVQNGGGNLPNIGWGMSSTFSDYCILQRFGVYNTGFGECTKRGSGKCSPRVDRDST
jgi:hypothetical protein